MELEEMKATWATMSDELKKQRIVTREIIMHMTQQRYAKKFRTVSIVETMAAIICFAVAIYILLNFKNLDRWYLIVCGVFTLGFLVVLPILVLKAIHKIRYIDIFGNSYKNTLLEYLTAKKNLLRLQRVGIYLSLVQLFAVSAVFAKIWSGKDFFMKDRGIWEYVPIIGAVLLILIIAKWGYNGYLKITGSAEQLLKELEEK